MTTVIDTIALLLNRRGRYVLSQLDGLTEAQLNQPLALPETNTLYQLVTHMTSSGEFWVLTMVGGRSTTRDRGAEWRSTGTLSDL
ncbi:MAG: mycothiol transferase [Dehalococcoidia bacterium]